MLLPGEAAHGAGLPRSPATRDRTAGTGPGRSRADGGRLAPSLSPLRLGFRVESSPRVLSAEPRSRRGRRGKTDLIYTLLSTLTTMKPRRPPLRAEDSGVRLPDSPSPIGRATAPMTFLLWTGDGWGRPAIDVPPRWEKPCLHSAPPTQLLKCRILKCRNVSRIGVRPARCPTLDCDSLPLSPEGRR